MTIQEYKDRKDKLREEYEEKKTALAKEFAFSNNSIQIGDTIEDHIGRIVVKSISFTRSVLSEKPECVYYGIELKKDGSPRKDMSHRYAHQSNLLTATT